jgi:hypothetical protein
MDLPDRHQTNDLPAEAPPLDMFSHSIPHLYNYALQNAWVSFRYWDFLRRSSFIIRSHPLLAMANLRLKAIVRIHLRQSGVLLGPGQDECKIRTASTWPIKVL